MIFLKAKDLKNRNLHNKNEINKNVKKFLFINLLNNKKYTKKEKTKFLYLLTKRQKKNKVKIVSRCILTNRSKGIFRPFNVSRLMLKEMIHLGLIPGYKKAVW